MPHSSPLTQQCVIFVFIIDEPTSVVYAFSKTAHGTPNHKANFPSSRREHLQDSPRQMFPPFNTEIPVPEALFPAKTHGPVPLCSAMPCATMRPMTISTPHALALFSGRPGQHPRRRLVQEQGISRTLPALRFTLFREAAACPPLGKNVRPVH